MVSYLEQGGAVPWKHCPVLSEKDRHSYMVVPRFFALCYSHEAKYFFKKIFIYLFIGPNQGSNPGPQQWKRGVLTTGPPGNSQDQVLLFPRYLSGCIDWTYQYEAKYVTQNTFSSIHVNDKRIQNTSTQRNNEDSPILWFLQLGKLRVAQKF